MEWLDRLVHDFQRSSTWLEFVLLLGAVALAYGLSRIAGRDQPSESVWFGRRTIDGLMFPVLALALVALCRLAVSYYQPVFLLRVAAPVLTACRRHRPRTATCAVRVSHVPSEDVAGLAPAESGWHNQ